MAHQCCLLRLRANHDSRTVAEKQDRKIKGITKLHETRGLVSSSTVNRSSQVQRIIGDYAERSALHTNQGGHHAWAELPPQLQYRVAIREHGQHRAHVVGTQTVLGNRRSQQPLVDAFPLSKTALKV